MESYLSHLIDSDIRKYTAKVPSFVSFSMKLLRHLQRTKVPFLAIVRAKSSAGKVQKLGPESYDFLTEEQHSNDSKLPFEARRNSETFGQLVRSLYMEQDINDIHAKYVKKTEFGVPQPLWDSPYRNEDGSFINGSTAEEARLHPLTLEARVDHGVAKLPLEIVSVINNNILSATVPDKLRERVAKLYQSINKDQIQKAPETPLDCDAHIAALFLQDYAHAHQVLLELQKRVGIDNFKPDSVLDVGYGPGTGMVALNELMGEEFAPKEKDIYVVGRNNNAMKKRAKIILSRQWNEYVAKDGVDIGAVEEAPEEETPEEFSSEASETLEEQEEEYVGPVDASRITIRSKLRDTLPVTKQYDLIMVNQSLLTREHSFPKDVDVNIHMILRLLKPNGHLVLIERGNPLGFETIARARQLMIRPEAHSHEFGKIPRPYIKGSGIKPQKLRKDDQLISDEDIAFEKELYHKYEQEDSEGDLEREINAKYGEPTEKDMKFEFEDNEDYEITSPDASHELSSESVDYHISIIAPCAHHSKCPLQLGDPKYYKIPSHKHRLSFCSFNKSVERPKFTLELKKGRRLATKWDKLSEDGFGLDSISRKTLKGLGGSGRPGGNNHESGSFSYLIAQRAMNSVANIKKIESDREFNHQEVVDNKNPTNWPRIVQTPTKIKNNVKLNVCSPSGNIEIWQIPKSMGKQTYHDARKVARGDLWPLEKKSVIVKNQLSDANKEKLDALAKTTKKLFLKEERKKQWKKLVGKSEDEFEEDIVKLSDALATSLEKTKKYKQKGKRAGFSVHPGSYDGK